MSPRRPNPTPARYVARNGEVSWRVRYRLGTGPDATATSETFKDRTDALDFCADIRDFGAADAVRRLAERANPTPSAAPRLDDVFDEFLAWTARRVRSSRTIEDYSRDYRKAIAPTFGRHRVDQITDSDIQRWVDAMIAGRVAARTVRPTGQLVPLSPKSIGDRHALLSTCLDYASKPPRRYLTGNPCSSTDLPKKHKKPPRGVRPAEWQALYRALQQVNPDGADLALALYSTGARFSEITALSPLDVEDFGGPRVTLIIGHVIRREAGHALVRVADTKSRAGFRRVTVDDEASAMIRRRLATTKPGGFLFSTATGAMWRPSNFRDRAWIPACALANLDPRPAPHGLRHAHVAELIRSGATLAQIRVRLGHESITTTLDVYGGLVEEVEGDVLARFAARRDGPPVEQGTVIRGELAD